MLGVAVKVCLYFHNRKLPVKNNATVVKVPTISNNTLQSNQSHLPKQEAKLKQNIKKSLLSKPIVVSKTTTRTENAGSMGPCKPAALNRPVNKGNTKSHPVKLVTVPHHSTPIKDQTAYRRKSVTMTPLRDSSETADKVVKQKRRSGIPLLGGMVRENIIYTYGIQHYTEGSIFTTVGHLVRGLQISQKQGFMEIIFTKQHWRHSLQYM